MGTWTPDRYQRTACEENTRQNGQTVYSIYRKYPLRRFDLRGYILKSKAGIHYRVTSGHDLWLDLYSIRQMASKKSRSCDKRNSQSCRTNVSAYSEPGGFQSHHPRPMLLEAENVHIAPIIRCLPPFASFRPKSQDNRAPRQVKRHDDSKCKAIRFKLAMIPGQGAGRESGITNSPHSPGEPQTNALGKRKNE